MAIGRQFKRLDKPARLFLKHEGQDIRLYQAGAHCEIDSTIPLDKPRQLYYDHRIQLAFEFDWQGTTYYVLAAELELETAQLAGLVAATGGDISQQHLWH